MPAPRPARAPAASATARAPHDIRIIGGQWKRTRLPVADRPGLRPTPDRVRETLFNWLGQDLTGWRCLDMFAGTGALGLEAASRGAAEVLLCELDPALAAQIARLAERLQARQVRVQRGDGIALAARLAPAGMDLVLLDPPFDAGLFDAALDAAQRVLAPRGRLYLEAPEPWRDERLAAHGLAPLRHLKAGAVHAHLLERLA
ncbi:16S rRNA (guanine(966)-N(2))-methyltransferase RsmD [Pseudorhodoferax sp.]|uniref:16S rRNA (guanine(966)-N(2))-methyltransferase RsmD n=1 Tax=Pseudorhodoferax sp. TaxID=1993553 RepID=UPI0039E5EBA0